MSLALSGQSLSTVPITSSTRTLRYHHHYWRNYLAVIVLLLALVINSASGSATPFVPPLHNHKRKRRPFQLLQWRLQESIIMTSSFVTKRATRGSTSSFVGTETAYGPQEHSEHAESPEATLPVSSTKIITPQPATTITTKNTTTAYDHHDPLNYWSSLVAGVGSGALSSVMCAPLDLVRTRLQVWSDLHLAAAASPVRQAFVDIWLKEGWRGYFRGLGASLVTVPAFWGCYFPLYDDCKRQWSKRHPQTNPSIVHCGSAVAAGAVSDVLCNPMFVVRTRLQTEALHHLADGTTQRGKSGILRTIRALYHEGGLPIFWRGMTANLMGLSHVAGEYTVDTRNDTVGLDGDDSFLSSNRLFGRICF